MASIQARVRSDGTTAYRVMFRLNARLVGETFDDPKAAQAFAQLVDRIGGQAARDLRDARDDYTDTILLKDWLRDHINRLTGVTDGTRKGYRSLARDHINPALGELPLEALTRKRLEAWINTLASAMSGKTLRNVRGLLSGALNRAVYEELLPANLAKDIRLPASDHNKREMVTLTQNEVTALVGAFPDRWQPFVSMLVGSGMRFGEITALPVGACDLDADPPTVRVRQAWKATGLSARELGAPKTRKARRVIPISRTLAEEIRPLVDGRDAEAFVFTSNGGGHVDHAHFSERVWKPALAAAMRKTDDNGDPRPHITKRPTIHDLRHTYATYMAARIPLDQLQRLLGHESIQTTVDVYGAARPGDAVAAAHAVAELLARALPAVEETRAIGQ